MTYVAEVLPDGTVGNVTVHRRDGTLSEEVVACAGSVIRGTTFSPPTAGKPAMLAVPVTLRQDPSAQPKASP